MKVCSFTASTLSWLQSRIGARALVTFALEGGGGDYLGHFGTGRSLMVYVREPLFYLTQQQQQQQKEECNLHIIYVRYSVNRLDYLVPELFNRLFAAQGDFHYHRVRIDRDIMREACNGLVRPRLCEVDSQQELA